MTIVDLACGTGSNLRHLAPRLGGAQQWRLIDHDPVLLARAPALLCSWALRHHWRFERNDATMTITADSFVARVSTHRADLSADPQTWPHLSTDSLPAAWPPTPVHLVTTSALLDLVSRNWLEQLIVACQRQRADVHWALTYDGSVEWFPADPFDTWITDALNQHQRTDKGFGVALGPAAAGLAQQLLQTTGMNVCDQRSDWLIGPDATKLQAALIDGWSAAAIDVDASQLEPIGSWAARRHSLLRAGRSTLRVGHRDVIASFSR